MTEILHLHVYKLWPHMLYMKNVIKVQNFTEHPTLKKE